MKSLAVVILAAGQGTRMKSSLVKVLHPLLGRPLLSYPLAAALALKPERTVLVVGVQADQVRETLRGQALRFAVQKEQKGTAHAVRAALPALKGLSGDVLVLYGDTPLLRPETARAIVREHRRRRARITILTAVTENNRGYGRIIRDERGSIVRIVEEKDCSPEQRRLREINPGLYCYDLRFLAQALPRVGNHNRQREYYLTDLVEIAVRQGLAPASWQVEDPREILGVNSRWELAAAADLLRERINRGHAESGVTIESPATAWIEPGVKIGRDAILEPDVRLTGKTVIGPGCVVEAGARVRDSVLGRKVQIKAGSVIEASEVKDGAQVGPMAHLRPGSVIGRNARIGNFVETKQAVIGDEVKASHLSYIGDARIGRNVNLGCGFITCNYDGVKKWTTVIEDDVFVGSDSQTVAPVKIGKGAYIGSGSTITREVPPGALALTRAPLVVKEGWAIKKFAASKKKRPEKKEKKN